MIRDRRAAEAADPVSGNAGTTTGATTTGATDAGATDAGVATVWARRRV